MNKPLIFLLKLILLPISLLYGVIILIRNKLYDWKITDSIEFNLPVISVGNITAGGTGKSPHIEYLIELFANQYRVATLSRGYKRFSKGFLIANAQSNSRTIGDEPFQFFSKYPQVTVCVAEERMTAIPQLLQHKPDIQIVLLDDAFQHRSVVPGLNLLLSDFDRLYTKDFILPFGLLREPKSGAKRADIILVTKCPSNLSIEKKNEIIQEIQPQEYQQVYFSSIQYKNLYPLTPIHPEYNRDTKVILVTGIANAATLKFFLESQFESVHHLDYKDHHYFNYDELEEIRAAYNHIESENKIIITTEKDASRLMLLQDKILAYQLPFFAQSIGVTILFDEAEKMNTQILNFVETYYPPREDNEVIFELVE